MTAIATAASSWKATATFIVSSSTSVTNSLSGTFVFKKAGLSKASGGNSAGTYDFESDGACTLSGFSATSAFTGLKGFGGSATLPTGFNFVINTWSADINVDTETSQDFTSIWKGSDAVAMQVTGSCAGLVSTGLPVPTTS